MKTALILDDNIRNHSIIRKKLEEEGFAVTSAFTLQQAKQAVLEQRKKAENFDRIICDLDLGKLHRKIDGYLFVRWCRKNNIKSKITLHSTAFNSRLGRALFTPFLHRYKTDRNITIQGKKVLLGRKRR